MLYGWRGSTPPTLTHRMEPVVWAQELNLTPRRARRCAGGVEPAPGGTASTVESTRKLHPRAKTCSTGLGGVLKRRRRTRPRRTYRCTARAWWGKAGQRASTRRSTPITPRWDEMFLRCAADESRMRIATRGQLVPLVPASDGLPATRPPERTAHHWLLATPRGMGVRRRDRPRPRRPTDRAAGAVGSRAHRAMDALRGFGGLIMPRAWGPRHTERVTQHHLSAIASRCRWRWCGAGVGEAWPRRGPVRLSCWGGVPLVLGELLKGAAPAHRVQGGPASSRPESTSHRWAAWRLAGDGGGGGHKCVDCAKFAANN